MSEADPRTAAIAAGAALLGVLLGQILQALRERGTRRHEDERRFIFQLRAMYSEYLALAETAGFALMTATGTGGMPTPTGTERSAAIIDLHNVALKLPRASSSLSLVAPRTVTGPVSKLTDAVRRASLDLSAFIEERLMDLDGLIGGARAAMRDHLIGKNLTDVEKRNRPRRRPWPCRWSFPGRPGPRRPRS
jgi:hypothetical protein